MNENAAGSGITLDDQADTSETLYGKRPDAEMPGYEVELDPSTAW